MPRPSIKLITRWYCWVRARRVTALSFACRRKRTATLLHLIQLFILDKTTQTLRFLSLGNFICLRNLCVFMFICSVITLHCGSGGNCFFFCDNIMFDFVFLTSPDIYTWYVCLGFLRECTGTHDKYYLLKRENNFSIEILTTPTWKCVCSRQPIPCFWNPQTPRPIWYLTC